jgi:hypothetical protein
LPSPIHHDPLEISGLDRPSPARDRQALLQQRRKLFFAQALTPAGQRRAVKRQLLPEHRFATEILEIRILYPSVAQIVHVLEDEKPRHQSRWQWRLFRPYATNRTETLGQKIPINLRGEPHQRMTKVDDRLQDERNKSSWRWSRGWLIVPPQPRISRQRDHKPSETGISKPKKTATNIGLSCKIDYLLSLNHSDQSMTSKYFTSDGIAAT